MNTFPLHIRRRMKCQFDMRISNRRKSAFPDSYCHTNKRRLGLEIAQLLQSKEYRQ